MEVVRVMEAVGAAAAAAAAVAAAVEETAAVGRRILIRWRTLQGTHGKRPHGDGFGGTAFPGRSAAGPRREKEVPTADS